MTDYDNYDVIHNLYNLCFVAGTPRPILVRCGSGVGEQEQLLWRDDASPRVCRRYADTSTTPETAARNVDDIKSDESDSSSVFSQPLVIGERRFLLECLSSS